MDIKATTISDKNNKQNDYNIAMSKYYPLYLLGYISGILNLYPTGYN